jgi:hypothetical protein
MSANNIIYIKKNKKSYSVFYQGCADNDNLGDLVGRFKTLEEAIKCAYEEINDCGGMVEYGVHLIGFDE